MDDLELARALRAEGERLKAALPALDGAERAAAEATLHFCSDLLLAVETDDQVMKTELLRQGEAAVRLLRPGLDRRN